jgi:CheY-like chemotaxis protein
MSGVAGDAFERVICMPKTVLIVEDDEDTRSIYASGLRARGYGVLTATQGAEGVHLARRNLPDLILLDIRMPVLNGWGAAHYLKTDPETRRIPIWGISAYDLDEEERTEVQRLGHFDHFLMKPTDPSVVIAEIEEVLGPPENGVPRARTPTPR